MKKLVLIAALGMCFAGAVCGQSLPAPQSCINEYKNINAEADKIVADAKKIGHLNTAEVEEHKINVTELKEKYDKAMINGKLSWVACTYLVDQAKRVRDMAKVYARY